MHIELLQLVTSGTQVLAGVELSRVVNEDLAYSSGHSQTAVRVDVDLANSALSSLAELLLGNTYCVLQSTTVSVDDLHVLLGNRRRTVQNDGEAGQLLLDLLEDVETQFGRNEDTLFVAGALLGLELVSTVRSTDRDSQRVATGLGNEVNNLLGASVVSNLRRNLVLYTCQYTELTLYGYIVLVSVLNHLLSQRYVLVVGEVATVDHNRRETHIDAILAELERVTVVEVQNDRNVLTQLLSVLNSTLSHIAEQSLVSVLTRTRRNLQDYGRAALNASRDDSLHLLHIVKVESGDSIATLDSLSEHLTGVHQTKIFVRYHSFTKCVVLSVNNLRFSLLPAGCACRFLRHIRKAIY